MKCKSFYLWLIVALSVFAVVSLGGCGGSSDNLPPNQASTEIPDISTITDSPEYQRVMSDLSAELSADRTATEPKFHTVLIISRDVFIDDELFEASVKCSAAANLPAEQIAMIAAKLKQPYESGDIIVLYFPSPQTINDIYVALGEQPMYFDPSNLLSDDSEIDSSDLYPEIYAIAKRYNGNSPHYFSYLLPGSKTVLRDIVKDIISSDMESIGSADVEEGTSDYQDDGRISDEYAGLRGAYVFQARRYANFIRWATHIDAAMEEDRAYASTELQARAAALDSNIFDYTAQRVTLNFDYYVANVDWDYWGKHSMSHSAGVAAKVYAFHNFADRKDYYIVQSTGFVKPDFDKRTEGNTVYTVGAMRKFYYRYYLPGAECFVFNNAPKNVNRSGSITDGTSYSTSDTIGFQVGMKVGASPTGPTAEMSTEMSASTTNTAGYNHSATWSTTEWSLKNECNNTDTKWTADFYDPANKGYYADWNTGDLPTAAKNRVDLVTEWMWQVNNPKKELGMKVEFYNATTDTKTPVDKSASKFTGYWWRRGYRTAKLAMPPHVICTFGNSHLVDKNGANNLVFKFLCSGNWTITSDQSWCQVAPESASGTDTGVSERSVFLYVDPYDTGSDTTPHNRRAIVTIKDTETGQIQTIDVLQSNR